MSTERTWRRTPRSRGGFQPGPGGRADDRAHLESEGNARRYEAHHRVSITDGALVAAEQLEDSYVRRSSCRKRPDMVDEQGHRKRIQQDDRAPGMREFDEKIDGVRPGEGVGQHRLPDIRKAAACADTRSRWTGRRRRGEEWKAGGHDTVAR